MVALPKKFKIELQYHPAIPLLGIYPKKPKIRSQRDICIPVLPMFIAALFTTAKIWKQPKRPLRDKQISKMWYISTMEFYLALKCKEILTHILTWMNLEDIMLSKIK